MYKISHIFFSAGLIAGTLSFICPVAQAATVYSSFGSSSPSYFAGTGTFVDGSSATVGGYQAVADSFTASGSFNLTTIDVAVNFRGIAGVFGTDSATVSIDSNNAGSPGAVLASSVITGLPTPVTSCCVVETINVSGVSVSSGTEYWIVVTPNNTDTDDIWNMGAGTPYVFGNDTQSSSGGTWTSASALQNAFDVNGTAAAPEPASLALGSGGLALLGLYARRRRKA